MSIRKQRLSACSILCLLFIGGMLWTTIVSRPCWGATLGFEMPIFSLDCKDESLKKIVEKISKATGYGITVSEGWKDISLTVKLSDVTVEEGLKKIIWLLGQPNHSIITDDKKKKIDIVMYKSISAHSADLKTGSMSQQHNEVDPLDLEVVPPENPGEKGITERELITADTIQDKVDPLDLEVVPPENPGERGIAERELIVSDTEQNKVDPLDLEVVPPESPEERGLTERELIATDTEQDMVDPLDQEMVPPEDLGE